MTAEKPKRVVWGDKIKMAIATECAKLLDYQVENIDRKVLADTFLAAQAAVLPLEQHKSLIDWHHINTWLSKLVRKIERPVAAPPVTTLDKDALNKLDLLSAGLRETKRLVTALSKTVEGLTKSDTSAILLTIKGLSSEIDELQKRTTSSVQRCGDDITHLEKTIATVNSRVTALSELNTRQNQLAVEQAALSRRLAEIDETLELHDLAMEIQEQESKAIRSMLEDLISKMEKGIAKGGTFNLRDALDKARDTAKGLEASSSNVVQFAQNQHDDRRRSSVTALHSVIVVGLFSTQLQELQVRYSGYFDITGISNKKGAIYIKQLCLDNPNASVFLLRSHASAPVEKAVIGNAKDYKVLSSSESVSTLYRHLDNLMEAKNIAK